MKINSNLPPNEGSRLDAPANSNQSEKAFPGTDPRQIPKPGETISSAALRAQFTQADFKNPGKINEMVDWGVGQIMDREFAAIRPQDRDVITSWMREDPLLRDAMLKYLEKLMP